MQSAASKPASPQTWSTEEPVLTRRPVWIAALTLISVGAPAVIAVLSLVVTVFSYGIPFTTDYKSLSLLVAVLSVMVLTTPALTGAAQLHLRALPTAFSLLIRWGVLLAILLAVLYLTKESSSFSRRVLLTWGLLTPPVLLVASAGFQKLLRQAMVAPGNARRVAFIGFNDASLSLATRIGGNADRGFKVMGFFDDRSEERLAVPPQQRLLGRLPDLIPYVRENGLEVVFVALPVRHLKRVLQRPNLRNDDAPRFRFGTGNKNLVSFG
jgi:putative colanic acid biosynthesis UDP-glucose lipid carrier transferase